MKKIITATVTPEYNNLKLDNFLKTALRLTKKEISRAKFRESGICINGERKKTDACLKTGDLVEVLLETGSETSKTLSAMDKSISVLYEDADVIIMDKPSGLSVHPVGKNDTDTLANRLACHLRNRGEDSVIRIFGRLDKDTSGVVLAVKNRAAAARLERQREKHVLFKTYLAVAKGSPDPPEGTINTPLAPDPKNRRQMRIDPEGKSAVTHYETVKYLSPETFTSHAGLSLIRLHPETGRTHQIRVHMASVGCPLAGDPLYGSRSMLDINRTALHAHTVHFLQPFTGEEILVTAPVPEDIRLLFPIEIPQNFL